MVYSDRRISTSQVRSESSDAIFGKYSQVPLRWLALKNFARPSTIVRFGFDNHEGQADRNESNTPAMAALSQEFAEKSLGFRSDKSYDRDRARARRIRYINLKLISLGLLPVQIGVTDDDAADAASLLSSYRERLKQLEEVRCPVDRRVEQFLAQHFADVTDEPLRLPDSTMIMDQHGLARELSLPVDSDTFANHLVSSYRVKNGVLHNPRHDRRTTKGTFHVVEGGLPVPADKKSVPKRVFVELFRHAMSPPPELMRLPFTANLKTPAETLVSLLLRPTVCPEVPGVCDRKSLEIRFFAPGALVSNFDFVESIFGNAGDPYAAANDAALDVRGWTGHTGAVILAPHLENMTKKDVGLPSWEDATDRQRRDGMCWKEDSELYNDGIPFKLTCRTTAGVIITLIADNYFGYCKKEVKTQISYAANLYGNVEEEHAGGAIAFPSYNLGDEFIADSRRYNGRTFADVARDYSAWIDVQSAGYGIDKQYRNLIYIPENAHATLRDQRVRWVDADGEEQSIPLLPERIYMAPSGYKLKLERHPEVPTWRLVGTAGEGTVCHKPCTVSGGGKSEISKSLVDFILYGPIFVSDVEKDLGIVDEIFQRDYTDRWKEDMPDKPSYADQPSRKVLDPDRTLGSVIKLLTPSPDYTAEYNDWLESIPNHIYALVFIIKRFQKPGWDEVWRDHFCVDLVNGDPGHELKYRDRKLVGSYLRIGLEGAWRTYKLRQDFAPADKIQIEDDISASVVIPAKRLGEDESSPSSKFVVNCEYRLFQRPDEAIHRGLDRQAEADLARLDNFMANFEPLSGKQVKEMVEYVVDLDQFTEPMQELLRSMAGSGSGYVVCSAEPRMINNKPSKNPRYLQDRPDLVDPFGKYVSEMGTRLFRAIPDGEPVRMPVNTVLLGRRNNPPNLAKGIRGLAVYNPIHYQELPELFMDFICSLTGKSPSTTGAGSEGALTKGPFNCLLPIIDLNAALVSFALTDLAGFSSAAGHIGPDFRVDHDISLLIPEIWCRLKASERDPKWLISKRLLKRVPDVEHNGEIVPASRLGYRISRRFVRWFFGRVFDNPAEVFTTPILKPETQDFEAYVDGVKYICEAHQRVALNYFKDGSMDQACPPLKAILHIMAHGHFEGKGLADPEIRSLFTRENVLNSDWYQERLATKQNRDRELWQRHIQYLETFIQQRSKDAESLNLAERLTFAQAELRKVRAPAYLEELVGTLGAEPLGPVDEDVPVAESAVTVA